MCDKLVFDLAQEVEGSPMVFVRKDWINILDNQTQNYTSNQSVLDTSQLSNSNKYMSYRESYFIIPLTVVMASDNSVAGINTAGANGDMPLMTPNSSAFALDSAVGLKNWFGNIIHSFTLDYNGSTIVQQTPFVNMWNSFKLMTSLSYQDVITQGCTIGFYPDDAETFEFFQPNAPDSRLINPVAPPEDAGNYEIYNGTGTCNNTNTVLNDCNLSSGFQSFKTGCGNMGYIERQKWISFDSEGIAGKSAIGAPSATASLYGSLLSQGNTALSQLWKSYVIRKTNQAVTAGVQTQCGVLQYAVIATVYLKHIHSFFNMVPLLKGVFMKMTMNLNNSASTVWIGGNVDADAVGVNNTSTVFSICQQTSSALGGVNPLMLASLNNNAGAENLAPSGINAAADGTCAGARPYRLSISVGGSCLDAQTAVLAGYNNGAVTNPCKSIYLYIPAYTFNPPFEQAYISSPVKQIKYTDIYQYQVNNVGAGSNFNNLLTNGIANIKSVLILPFYSSQNDTAVTSGGAGTLEAVPQGITLGANTGFIQGVPVWQSPFDPAGCGCTSPLCHFSNFNVQISGQNAIYNLQLRAFEQFNNQLYGQNAVNGGLTDGITSSLINRQNFDLEYCYYYVNVERMLPVEQAVPKSVQILGTSQSAKAVDLMCFVEYGNEVSIDVLTGARV
jgi:hypothetical protein